MRLVVVRWSSAEFVMCGNGAGSSVLARLRFRVSGLLTSGEEPRDLLGKKGLTFEFNTSSTGIVCGQGKRRAHCQPDQSAMARHPYQCIASVRPSSQQAGGNDYLLTARGSSLQSLCLSAGSIVSEWNSSDEVGLSVSPGLEATY